MKQMYHVNTKQKKARVSVLMSDKVDFKTRNSFRKKRDIL